MALLRLFVVRVLLAPLAELRELETGLQGLLVLARVVVHAVALGALHLDQVVLGHTVLAIGKAKIG